MTQFPTGKDEFQNPGATTAMNAAGVEHDLQHTNLNDAVAALQTKVGVDGSTDANSLDYKLAKLLAMLTSPDSSVRIKDGQLQIWDTGYNAYVPLVSKNGTLGVGDPVA